MMLIRYVCNNCGQKCKSQDEYAGLKAKCSQCGILLEIPRTENVLVHTIEGHEHSPVVQNSAEVQKLQQVNQSLRMENVGITVQLNKYKTDLDSITTEIASLKKEQELLEMQKQVETLKNEIAELKKSENTNSQMHEDINAVKDENQQLNEQLTKSRNALEEFNNKCAKLIDEANKMQQSVNALEMDKKNLNLLLTEKDKMLEHLKDENKITAVSKQIIMDPLKEVSSELKTHSNMIELMPGSDKKAVPALAMESIEIPETSMTTELQPEKNTAEYSLNSDETKSSHSKNIKVMEKRNVKELLLTYTVVFMLAFIPLLIVALFVISYYKTGATATTTITTKPTLLDSDTKNRQEFEEKRKALQLWKDVLSIK